MRWFRWGKICPKRFKRRQLNFSANVFFSIPPKKLLDFVLKRERCYGGLSLEFGFRDLVCFAPNFIHSCMTAKKSCGKCFKEMTTVQMRTWHDVKIGRLWMVCFSWFKHRTFCIEFRKMFPWDILRHTISQLQLLNFEMSLYSSLPTKNMVDIRNIHPSLYFGTESRNTLWVGIGPSGCRTPESWKDTLFQPQVLDCQQPF